MYHSINTSELQKILKLFCCGLWICITLFSFSLSAHAQTVTGSDFELKDSRGNLTAQLTTSSEGTPALFFFDAQHVPRISIGLYPDGAPGVVLNDDTGKAGAIMRLVQSNGNPVVVLKENGQDKVIIDKNGVPPGSSSIPTTTLLTLVVGFVGGLGGSLIAQRVKATSMPVS